ncbi:hypothetical protein [Streptomyces sp. HF10]|uniref:hypothetical protein n=1 Tax=Streptomyces sp. HF10 TaxID=2692233 RepID=UPI0019159FD1|nr:hypothetical protein [Streptomyces sp. HF10]
MDRGDQQLEDLDACHASSLLAVPLPAIEEHQQAEGARRFDRVQGGGDRGAEGVGGRQRLAHGDVGGLDARRDPQAPARPGVVRERGAGRPPGPLRGERGAEPVEGGDQPGDAPDDEGEPAVRAIDPVSVEDEPVVGDMEPFTVPPLVDGRPWRGTSGAG